MLIGQPEYAFEKRDSDRWDQVSGHNLGGMHKGLDDCVVPDTDDYLLWHPDGAIEVYAADLFHDMAPSATHDRWFGTASPLRGSTAECDAGLARLGLAWPVSLTMELLDVAPPDAR